MNRSNRGFTLVEVLVAFTILGLVLATLYRIVGDSIGTIEAAERSQRLFEVADSAWHLMKLMESRDPKSLNEDWPA